jgi:hypothetical protein
VIGDGDVPDQPPVVSKEHVAVARPSLPPSLGAVSAADRLDRRRCLRLLFGGYGAEVGMATDGWLRPSERSGEARPDAG